MGEALLSRLEIDVMQANELFESVEIAVKYQVPALVVHPGLAFEAKTLRSTRQGRFKIITPVDWPKGENVGITKFRGLTTESLDADGYEFLLNAKKSVSDIQNEMRVLTDFVRSQISQIAEIRFVFGAQMISEDEYKNACAALNGIPLPQMVRTDHHIKLQTSKANPDIHNTYIKMLFEVIRPNVKISGNINSIKAITSCPDAQRYAVNLVQAKAIIKEIMQQPEELKELLEKS